MSDVIGDPLVLLGALSVHVQAVMRLAARLLLDDLLGVELDEHTAVSFQLVDGDEELEVVEEEELEFEVVEFHERETTDLEMAVSSSILNQGSIQR